MRRIVVVFCALAVVALAASSAAFGQVYSFWPSTNMNACGSYPWIPHDSDPVGSNGIVPYFTDPTTGPFVTEDGLIWMKNPSGTWSNGSQYQLFDPAGVDWSLRATVSVETTTGWQVVDDGLNLPSHTPPPPGVISIADWSCSLGYPGMFCRPMQDNLPSNVTITGMDNLPHQTLPDNYGHAFNQVTVMVQAWLDPAQEHDASTNNPPYSASSAYSTYQQAVAASKPGSGVFVAQTTFPVDVEDITSFPMDWPNWMGQYMPALILQELTPLPGDANGDGKVDINDLTIVLAHYGQTGMTWSQGEFTGDGTVDINDLTIVLAHYGQTAGSADGLSAVPEPSVILLAATGLLGLLVYAWRRRK